MTLLEGWRLFASGWLWVGVPWWAVALAALLLCVAAQALSVAVGDRLEIVRRRRILERLKQAIPASIALNAAKFEELRLERIRLKILRSVQREPVELLLHQRGIGARSIEAFRRAGFSTLGDLLNRPPRAFRVGNERGGAALDFIAHLLNERLGWALEHEHRVPPDPEVDRVFDEALAMLSARQKELDTDGADLARLQETIDRFESSCRDTTLVERFRQA